MSSERDWAYRRAKEIDADLAEWMLEAIASAIRDAARVPEGCVRTADGVDRKVVGTLPITADGCVVMPGQMVYVPGYASAWTLQPELIVAVATQDADGHWRDMVVGECYTTYEACREAALAQPTPARGEGENVTCEHDIIRTACPTCNIWASTHRPKEPAND